MEVPPPQPAAQVAEIPFGPRSNDWRPTLRGIPDVIAFLCSLPAGVILARHASTEVATFSAIVFSLSLSLMLGTSGIYHSIDWSEARKKVLARFDYASIYVLIGMSYTPFCLSTGLAHGPQILGLMWAFTALGVAYSLFRHHSSRLLRAAFYVIMGVGMVPNVVNLYHAIPLAPLVLAIGGGAAYIVGAAVYVARWPNPIPKHFAHHEVFHLFVFMGAGCHYAAIWQIVG